MSDLNKPPRQWAKVVWLVLLAAPALSIGVLIYLYGVDVPYWDQWDGICPLFEKMEAGTLGIGNFFALHSEHRIFFPRLICFGLGIMTHWNIRAELFGIWFFGLICAFNLWKLSRVTGWGNSRLGAWLLVAANVLFFTPLAYETWLMGIQFVFVLPLVSLTGCMWLSFSERASTRFIATAVLATISTFCMASGSICWALTGPLLLLRDGKAAWREHKGWWIFWLSVFVVDLALYFNGYQKPTYHPNTMEFALRPVDAIQYVFAYLGADFGFATAFPAATVAALAGGGMMLLLGGIVAYLIWQRRDLNLLTRATPWLMLASFALANAALTTAGRLGFGIMQALSSRYIAFSIMLPISLVFLTPLIALHWKERISSNETKLNAGMALASIATAFALLHLLGAIGSVGAWRAVKRTRLIDKALVLTINVVDEPEALGKFVHAIVPPLKARANLLDHLGYLRPPLLRTKQIRDIADAAAAPSSENGEIQQGGKAGEGQWAIAGWAFLPESHRPADAVLLTYDDEQGNPMIFGLAILGTAQNEIAQKKNDPAYLQAGWITAFEDKKLPSGAKVVKAWAFDAEHSRAYRLPGEAVVPR